MLGEQGGGGDVGRDGRFPLREKRGGENQWLSLYTELPSPKRWPYFVASPKRICFLTPSLVKSLQIYIRRVQVHFWAKYKVLCLFSQHRLIFSVCLYTICLYGVLYIYYVCMVCVIIDYNDLQYMAIYWPYIEAIRFVSLRWSSFSISKVAPFSLFLDLRQEQ